MLSEKLNAPGSLHAIQLTMASPSSATAKSLLIPRLTAPRTPLLSTGRNGSSTNPPTPRTRRPLRRRTTSWKAAARVFSHSYAIPPPRSSPPLASPRTGGPESLASPKHRRGGRRRAIERLLAEDGWIQVQSSENVQLRRSTPTRESAIDMGEVACVKAFDCG